jgi:membrane protein YdbS with pleckstrin-like domain
MNINRSSLFWGILLIGAGVLALGAQLGYIRDLTATSWTFVFAAISLIAFVSYAMSGWTEWGWLFPAGIFGGLALTITLATNDVDTAAVASPLFIGLLIPFIAAYLTNRTQNWWALIPGGVMLFLTMVTLLVDYTPADEWIGAMLFFMVAISFLLVYLNNRQHWWALLVAYITAVIGIAPLMSIGGRNAEYFGSVFLFAVALPFFVLYFRSAENWWAIIPAGAVTVVGVIATLAIANLINDATSGGRVGALLMAGLAATFSVLWLRHGMSWAKIVTILLAVMAVASAFFISYYETFWPVAFILGGLYLLYIALRKPRPV